MKPEQLRAPHAERGAYSLTTPGESPEARQEPPSNAQNDGHIVSGPWPLTDSGNAERLVHHRGGDIRYVKDWRKWSVWDGHRWELDQENRVLGMTKEVTRSIPYEAALAASESEKKDILSWANRSESQRARQAMVRLAACEPRVETSFTLLDRQPLLLNCQNGTVDLATGRLRMAHRDDLITQIAPVRFDSKARCPNWIAFLERIMPREEDRAFLQRAIGYSITGSTEEHAVFFCHGIGANGKSTLLETILEFLGRDYGIASLPSLLLSRSMEHPTAIADLFGKRVVIATEFNAGERFNEALLKRLSGGDMLRARRMREDSWQFRPSHHLWIAANDKPIVWGTDHGFWRRIHLIPFDVTIPKEEQDPKLRAKLAAELPGILNWALAGCREFLERGLDPPRAIVAATGAYRAEMDTVASFLDSDCVLGDGLRATSGQLYDAYRDFVGREGGVSLPQKAFTARLKAEGFSCHKSNGRTTFTGIGLLAPDGEGP